MIQVTTDPEKKLIEVALTGMVKANEAARASSEVKKAMMPFAPKDAVLLIDLIGFAPMTQDVMPIVRGMGRDVITNFRKTALVQDFSMSFGGGRKIIEPPPGYKVPSFHTREEALQYLLAEE